MTLNLSLDVIKCSIEHQKQEMDIIVLDSFNKQNTKKELINEYINMQDKLRFIGKCHIYSGATSSRFSELNKIELEMNVFSCDNLNFVKSNFDNQGIGTLRFWPKQKEDKAEAFLGGVIFIEKQKYQYLHDFTILRITSRNVGISLGFEIGGYTYEHWHDIEENDYNEFASGNKKLLINDFNINIYNVK